MHVNGAGAVKIALLVTLIRRLAVTIDAGRIDDCVLALLLLGWHDHQRVRKSSERDTMDRLYGKGLISDPVGRAKSVIFTSAGLESAERLFEELFAKKP